MTHDRPATDTMGSPPTPSPTPGPAGAGVPHPMVEVPAESVGRRPRWRGERGEGVISTAIAVLIVAFLGVGMWAGFNAIFSDAADQTRTQVERIGR